jgi:hypothetical protein
MHSGASGVARLERVCGRAAPERAGTRRNAYTISSAAPELSHWTSCRGSRGSASLPSLQSKLVQLTVILDSSGRPLRLARITSCFASNALTTAVPIVPVAPTTTIFIKERYVGSINHQCLPERPRMTPRINRRVPCSDTHRPKWIPIHFYVQGQNITLPKSLTKIDSGAFIRERSGVVFNGNVDWPSMAFSRIAD